jgi:hypothetical protein
MVPWNSESLLHSIPNLHMVNFGWEAILCHVSLHKKILKSRAFVSQARNFQILAL